MGKAWRAPDQTRKLKRYATAHALERLRERIPEGSEYSHQLDRDMMQWLDWAVDSAISDGRFCATLPNERIVNISTELQGDAYVVVVHDGKTRRPGFVETRLGEFMPTVLNLEQAVQTYGFTRMCLLMNPGEWAYWKSRPESPPIAPTDHVSYAPESIPLEDPGLIEEQMTNQGVLVPTATIDKNQRLSEHDLVLVETILTVAPHDYPGPSYATMAWARAREMIVASALAHATAPDAAPRMRVFKHVPIEARVEVVVHVDDEV